MPAAPLRRKILLSATLAGGAVALIFTLGLWRGRTLKSEVLGTLPPSTVEGRMEQFGPAADARLRPHFARAGVAYPPARLVLAGLKAERVLELYAASPGGPLRFIRAYPILAASGGPGPKLREGDCQVPEGLYAIESLNPNSRFHLSLRVNYPNAFDRQHAAADGRERPGSDIMIHGSRVSAGCLAMGDPASEELFVLAQRTGLKQIAVILAPCDFRVRELPAQTAGESDTAGGPALPAWVERELYPQIRAALKKLPRATTPEQRP